MKGKLIIIIVAVILAFLFLWAGDNNGFFKSKSKVENNVLIVKKLDTTQNQEKEIKKLKLIIEKLEKEIKDTIKMESTRKEHLDWCKQRALEYVDNGDLNQAFSSMISDLGKHSKTDGHVGIALGMGLLMAGKLNTEKEMRDFINGFN